MTHHFTHYFRFFFDNPLRRVKQTSESHPFREWPFHPFLDYRKLRSEEWLMRSLFPLESFNTWTTSKKCNFFLHHFFHEIQSYGSFTHQLDHRINVKILITNNLQLTTLLSLLLQVIGTSLHSHTFQERAGVGRFQVPRNVADRVAGLMEQISSRVQSQEFVG